MIQVSKNPENTPTLYIQTFLDQLLSDTHLCKKMETAFISARQMSPTFNGFWNTNVHDTLLYCFLKYDCATL